jgi:hypothetical protein
MDENAGTPAIEARELSRTFKGGIEVDKILVCLGVTLAMGVVLIGLSLRAIETYDR